MAVTGAHVLLYSPEADAVRALLGEVLGTRSVDAGGGWLIFALPPAEIAVHPTGMHGGEVDARPHHEVSLMCDDLGATIEELVAKGVELLRGPRDDGFGITAQLGLPGGLQVMLYEPRHPTAI
jgi:hypothetical protein